MRVNYKFIVGRINEPFMRQFRDLFFAGVGFRVYKGKQKMRKSCVEHRKMANGVFNCKKNLDFFSFVIIILLVVTKNFHEKLSVRNCPRSFQYSEWSLL